MKSLYKNFDSFLSATIRPIIFLIGMFVSLGFVIGIISRSILGESIFGIEELILLSVIWLYMLGATQASQERSHLQGDFLPLLVKSEKAVKFFQILTSLISVSMAFLFLIWSYDLLIWGINKGQSTPVFSIPWYFSQSSLLVCSFLMIIYATRDLINDIASFLKHSH